MDGFIIKYVSIFVTVIMNPSITFSGALIGYSISEYPALFTDSPPVSPSERRQTHVSCDKREWSWCKVKKKRKKPSSKGDAGRRRFATTIFSTTQRCNIVLDACNTVSILQRCVALKVVFADRPV